MNNGEQTTAQDVYKLPNVKRTSTTSFPGLTEKSEKTSPTS